MPTTDLSGAAQALVALGNEVTVNDQHELVNDATSKFARMVSDFMSDKTNGSELRGFLDSGQLPSNQTNELPAGSDGARTSFTDKELDAAWSLMLHQLPDPQRQLVTRATTPSDTAYIRAEEDGTPVLVSSLEKERKALEGERDEARAKLAAAEQALAAERDDSKPESLAGKLKAAEAALAQAQQSSNPPPKPPPSRPQRAPRSGGNSSRQPAQPPADDQTTRPQPNRGGGLRKVFGGGQR